MSARFPSLETTLAVVATGALATVILLPAPYLTPALRPLAQILGAVWASWRVLTLQRRLQQRAAWRGGGLWTVTPETLPTATALTGAPGDLYLGQAFRWLPTHTEQLEGLLLTEGFLPLDPGPRGGFPALHAVGQAAEQAQVLPEVETFRHMAITGTPGSGKTQLLRILVSGAMGPPAPLARTRALAVARRARSPRPAPAPAVVVIDPKGDRDLLLHTALEAHRHHKPFTLLLPAFPQLSATMNVLSTCAMVFEMSARVRSLMPSAGGRANDPFFEEYALALLERLARVQQVLGEPWTLEGLYAPAVIRSRLETLVDRYLEHLGCPNTPLSGKGRPGLTHRIRHYHRRTLQDLLADELLDDLEKPQDHFRKVTASLIPAFRGVTGPPLGALFSTTPGDLDWDRIVDEGRVVYVGLASMLLGDIAHRIGRVIVQDLIGFLGRRYAYDDAGAAPPLTLIVDEVHQLLYPQFTTAFAMSRGARCRWILAQQSLADTEAKLGPAAARVLMDSCVNKLFFQLADTATAAEVSEGLGKVWITLPNPPRVTLGYGGVGGLQGSTAQAPCRAQLPLVRPEWLYALPMGEYFGRLQGVPWKGRVPLVVPAQAEREADRLGLHRPWQALDPQLAMERRRALLPATMPYEEEIS